MKILTVGGGSGGHIMPVVAVVEQLRKLAPEAEIHFWCDRKSHAIAEAAFVEQTITLRTVAAGKFRRYHHFTWWQHLRPSIVLPNLIDIFKIGVGFVQSCYRLVVWRPDVVFAKGGFVCLPVGLVAHWLGIKLIIHDSDTVAGLTNRILAKYAVRVTTGMPIEYYNYPPDKTVFVGSPVRHLVRETTGQLRRRLSIADDKQVVLVAGGGLGSDFLNRMAMANLEQLSDQTKVILLTGRANYQQVINRDFDQTKLIVRDFVNNFTDYLALADLVVVRAGATTIAELAALRKPAILIPNPKLVEGHQLKNAQRLADQRAAIVLDEFTLEQDPKQLGQAINQLLTDKSQLRALGRRIGRFANQNSALTLAKIIIAEAEMIKDGGKRG